MKKRQVAFIENLLAWRGTGNLIAIIFVLIILITFLIGISMKEMDIVKQHEFIIEQQKVIESQTQDIQKQLNDYIMIHK